MKTKKQMVEKYSNLHYAKSNIERNILNGWYVHTCVSFCNNDYQNDGVLVIYEKELESYN